MHKPLKMLSLDEQEELQEELAAEYERRFGCSYPPFFGCPEDKIRNIKRHLKEGKPCPQECNNRDLCDL